MPPRKPRFERQLAAERRLALIAATIESLQRDGHEGLSVRRIAARAGVSIGLINHHFPKKEQLVAQAYKHFNRTLAEGFRAAVDRAPRSARARLRAFFRATFSPPNLDPDVLSAWVVFWGLCRHSAEIQRVHDDAYGGYVELLRDLLSDFAREHGKFRLSLRLAAIGLNAMLDGLWLEWCLAPNNFRASEAVTICESWVESLRIRSKPPRQGYLG
jgi:TetR/AcrR family transcriptional repressor of bet genes